MILSKTISTAKVQLLVIGGLPEDCVLAKHKYEKVHFRYKELDGSWAGYDVPGNWQPVGFLKDLNEDDAKGMVEKIGHVSTGDVFMRYTDENSWCWTAKESLLSLIESEVKLKNPLADSISAPDIDEWQAEQSEVFTNPFILIKK